MIEYTSLILLRTCKSNPEALNTPQINLKEKYDSAHENSSY